jgi:hypothetical protein
VRRFLSLNSLSIAFLLIFIGSLSRAIFSVYLRQRGSPESKPVGAPHHETASTG